MKKLFLAGLLGLGFLGCQSEKEVNEADKMELTLEFQDSIIVNSLSELYLAAINEQNGQMIFKDRFMENFTLTDSRGEILQELKLKGEGPDQLAFPMEMGFVGDQLVIKQISPEMELNFFDRDFKKGKASKAIALGLSMIEINRTLRTFSPFISDGKQLIVGSEANAVDPMLMSKEKMEPGFYSKAESGYVYDPATDSLYRFNAYPDSWEPKLAGKWVGVAWSYVSALNQSGVIALLPRVGKQLFFYTWKNGQLVLTGESILQHPDRNESVELDPDDQPFLYPAFSDLKGGKDYFLVEFHTEMPKDVHSEFRAKSENYVSDPEFGKALSKYRLPKYLLVNKVGESQAILELPIEGAIHYLDQQDQLYIKPSREKELDYNVYYRYKIKSGTRN